jgi:uncharacterized coiled-coil DUF342 family protein
MKDDQFETLARMIKEGADEMRDFRGEMNVFKAQVAEQFSQVHTELRTIHDEVRDVSRRIEKLEEAVQDIRGYAKELDELRGRIRAIEHHLGIEKRIAA